MFSLPNVAICFLILLLSFITTTFYEKCTTYQTLFAVPRSPKPVVQVFNELSKDWTVDQTNADIVGFMRNLHNDHRHSICDENMINKEQTYTIYLITNTEVIDVNDNYTIYTTPTAVRHVINIVLAVEESVISQSTRT